MANSLRLARERDETINNVKRVLFGMIHRRADGLKMRPPAQENQDLEVARYFTIIDKHCRWRYEHSGFVNL